MPLEILANIGSGNGLTPVRCQAITWTNTDLLLITPVATNFSEILIKIQQFSFKKMHVKNAVCGKAAILSARLCVNSPCLSPVPALLPLLFGSHDQSVCSHICKSIAEKVVFLHAIMAESIPNACKWTLSTALAKPAT